MYEITIISQNKIFAESLKTALNQFNEFDVKFTNSFCEQKNNQAKVLLLDTSTKLNRCLEIIHKSKKKNKDIIILLLSNYSEKIIFKKLLNAGANDIINANSSKNQYIKKILSFL